MAPPPRSPLRFLPALLAAAILFSAAPSPPPASGQDIENLPEVRAPLRLDRLARAGAVTFRHSEGDLGRPEDAFDGKTGTEFRTAGVNPAFLEATFTEPREVLSAQALFPGGARHEWSLLAGDDPDGLQVVFRQRAVDADAWSRVVPFRPPLRARVFRVVVKRFGGEDSIRFGEIALESNQRPLSLEVSAPSGEVTPRGMLPARARVLCDGGFVTTTIHGMHFETPRDSGLRIEPVGPWDPSDVMLRFERPGTFPVRVSVAGRRGTRIASPWREFRCESEGRPDWSLGFMERTPRTAVDDRGGGWPAIGSNILWVAHVRNYGTADAPRVTVRWEVDGKIVLEGVMEGLRRFQEGTASIRLPWDGKQREIRCIIDPQDEFSEVSEGNNARTVGSHSLSLGLWIERPLPRFFGRTQPAIGDGAVCFEDWAQRQVERWNRLLAEAKHPLTPEGITSRVFLDRVVFVEEGGLPLASGSPAADPDARDSTVDFMWGFPASIGEGEWPAAAAAAEEGNPLRFHAALLREFARARGLPDLSRLDVRPTEVDLPGPAGLPLAGSVLLPVDEEGFLHRTAAGGLTAGDLTAGFGPHAAFALERRAGRRTRGGNRSPSPLEGEDLGDLPLDCFLLVTDPAGKPLDGVTVRAWRRAPGTGGAMVFSGAPVRAGETREGGHLSLTLEGRDPFFEGRRGGPLDAGQGVLLLELSRGGQRVFRFLEVVPFNLAFWGGADAVHRETVRVELP